MFTIHEQFALSLSTSLSPSPSTSRPRPRPRPQTNMVFAGTMVTVGNAYAVVTDTAMTTEIGKIQSGVQAAKGDEEKTPLAQKLDEFGDQVSGWSVGSQMRPSIVIVRPNSRSLTSSAIR